MIVFRTKRWTEQPPVGAQINWGHPLTVGLLGLFLLDEQGGLPQPFISSSFGPSTPGGTPTWKVNEGGSCRAYSATSDYDQSVNQVQLPNDRATVAMIRRKTDTTLRAASHFGTAGSGNRLQCHCPYSDGVVYWDHGGDSGASLNRLSWSGYTVSTVVERWVFTAGPSGMGIYLKGSLVASSGTAITAASLGIDSLIINQWDAVNPGDLAEVSFLGWWDAQWTPTMVAQWYAEPYALLLSQNPRIRYFFPSIAVEAEGTALWSGRKAIYRGGQRGVGRGIL